jgi:hypothetical protein
LYAVIAALPASLHERNVAEFFQIHNFARAFPLILCAEKLCYEFPLPLTQRTMTWSRDKQRQNKKRLRNELVAARPRKPAVEPPAMAHDE